MRIGILTFHNGTNYGGTLQAYATQEFLKSLGHEVIIINFAPLSFRDKFYKCFTSSYKYRNIKSYLLDYFKEPRFKEFRNEYMNLSDRYYTQDDIISNILSLNLDACISGSDQVWSPYMAMNWGKPYFQSSFPLEIKRIAYAVSFSCSDYPKEAMEAVIKDIKQFSRLSVRENSGKRILENNGFENIKIMPDPTFLFDKTLLKDLADKGKNIIAEKDRNFNNRNNEYVYFYILQQNQKLISQIKEYFEDRNNIYSKGNVISSENKKFRFEGIEEWLARINNSKLIVTNSFHGAVFSLLFHRPFILIPVEGKLSGMNDRIITLMESFNLQNRIIDSFNPQNIEEIEKNDINWDLVDKKIDDLKKLALEYYQEALK